MLHEFVKNFVLLFKHLEKLKRRIHFRFGKILFKILKSRFFIVSYLCIVLLKLFFRITLLFLQEFEKILKKRRLFFEKVSLFSVYGRRLSLSTFDISFDIEISCLYQYPLCNNWKMRDLEW